MTDILKRMTLFQDSAQNFNIIDRKLEASNLHTLRIEGGYDLVLAFNIIHHLHGNIASVIDNILNLGKNVLIEVPDVLFHMCPYIEKKEAN